MKLMFLEIQNIKKLTIVIANNFRARNSEIKGFKDLFSFRNNNFSHLHV